MATQPADVIFSKGGIRERVDAFFASMGQSFNAYLHHRSRYDEIQKMNAKSDAELAEMGVKRDDIPRYVFRDLFYI